MIRWLPALLLLTLGVPAFAGDGDDEDSSGDPLDDLLDEDDDDDDDGADTKRFDSPDDLDEGDDLDLDATDDPEGGDILDEPIDAPTSADSAATYRKAQERVADLDPDEEVEVWERYLELYPETPFRTRIEKRIDELMSGLYGEHIGGPSGPVDARVEEIKLAQGLLIENINPRTRIVAGFEWGLPAFLGLHAGYEHQLRRNLSVHGDLRGRYQGWNAEAGVRYALVKAERTQMLVTLIGDLHFNFQPAYLGIRPQVGVGKIFGDRLHVQAQTGVDLEVRGTPGLHWIGGANVTFMASKAVALFGETGWDVKNLTFSAGSFRFNTAMVGMKFLPNMPNSEPGSLELNVGASIPYATQYWKFHFGSVMAQVNYYPTKKAKGSSGPL